MDENEAVAGESNPFYLPPQESYQDYKQLERLLTADVAMRHTVTEKTTRIYEPEQDAGYYKTLILTLPSGKSLYFYGPTKRENPYKVGDFVRVIRTGEIGEVRVVDSPNIGVVFAEHKSGRHTLNGTTTMGHGWFYHYVELELTP